MPIAKGGRHWPRATWDAVRTAWACGLATIPQLESKYGIPRRTIESKAYRERWGTAKTTPNTREVTAQVSANAVTLALARPILTAQRLVQRTLEEAEEHLNSLADRRKENPENRDYARLTGAWAQVVKVARLTHGLDAAEAHGKPRIDQVIDAEIIDVQTDPKQG